MRGKTGPLVLSVDKVNGMTWVDFAAIQIAAGMCSEYEKNWAVADNEPYEENQDATGVMAVNAYDFAEALFTEKLRREF